MARSLMSVEWAPTSQPAESLVRLSDGRKEHVSVRIHGARVGRQQFDALRRVQSADEPYSTAARHRGGADRPAGTKGCRAGGVAPPSVVEAGNSFTPFGRNEVESQHGVTRSLLSHPSR